MEIHSEENRKIKTEILRDKERNPDPPRETQRAPGLGKGTETQGNEHSQRET